MVAIAGIGSWVEEARILVLHKLGYIDADRIKSNKEWYKVRGGRIHGGYCRHWIMG